MPIDKELIKSKIHSTEDISLKTIADIIAYKIYESPENMGPESNFSVATEAVSQYVSENFKDFDSFKAHLSQLDKGMKSINEFADTVYNYYQDKQLLSFEIIKNMISRANEMNLKMITDIVPRASSRSARPIARSTSRSSIRATRTGARRCSAARWTAAAGSSSIPASSRMSARSP